MTSRFDNALADFLPRLQQSARWPCCCGPRGPGARRRAPHLIT